MFGQFYLDCLEPFTINPASVTLATTNKALYGVQFIKAMGKDFWRVNRKVIIYLFGQITTAATPGNLVLSVVYGTGADANGVSLQSTSALTLIASQTNLTWEARIRIKCVSDGPTGTLLATGNSYWNSAVIAAHHGPIPASAATPSAACDLTVASNILSVQANRSGSTAETMQVLDGEVVVLN